MLMQQERCSQSGQAALHRKVSQWLGIAYPQFQSRLIALYAMLIPGGKLHIPCIIDVCGPDYRVTPYPDYRHRATGATKYKEPITPLDENFAFQSIPNALAPTTSH